VLAARASSLDELVASLPGLVRRGYAPAMHAGASDRLPTGIADLDGLLEGGLPRGRLTELVATGRTPAGRRSPAPAPRASTSTGATTLAYRLASSVTSRAEQLVAWIDAADALDPTSASAAGVDLTRVLWVRPPDLGAAFSASELVLAGGGFPLVVLDMLSAGRSRAAQRTSFTAQSHAARTPRVAARGRGAAYAMDGERRSTAPSHPGPHVWIRLSRAAAQSRSALVVLAREEDGSIPQAGSFAALRLELAPARARWTKPGDTPAARAPLLLDGLAVQLAVTRNRGARREQALALPLG
jgi:hypothetical protein